MKFLMELSSPAYILIIFKIIKSFDLIIDNFFCETELPFISLVQNQIW